MDFFRRTTRGKHRLYFYSSIGLVALLFLLMYHAYFSHNEYWTEERVNRELGLTSNMSNREKLRLLRNNASQKDMMSPQLNPHPGLTIHNLLNNVEVVCHRKLRIGNLGSGGWEICDDVDVRPRQRCVVYSFSINNDFSFDDQIAEIYGCHVYVFDPTMADGSYNRSSRVHVYTGASVPLYEGKDSILSLDHVRAKMGHGHNIIDVVRMDRASTEWWDLLDVVLTHGGVTAVRQLLLGVQVAPVPGEGVLDGALTTEQRLTVLWALNAQGFRVFHSYKNPACGVRAKEFVILKTMCYEVAYMFVHGMDQSSRLARERERKKKEERKNWK